MSWLAEKWDPESPFPRFDSSGTDIYQQSRQRALRRSGTYVGGMLRFGADVLDGERIMVETGM